MYWGYQVSYWQKKEEKIAQQMSLKNTFEAIAREWHQSKADRWSL
ncbi:Phage integrase family protein [Shigella dysenteriae 1617]|uniref:Phage integrase family protein n=1 Tax=Shigella dysenteriae 1617 TaxID=754093 RepID=A0A0A7A3T5_SHIDY|nr:Phage integrase family protein [Shigella dysenteriae 1617]